MLVTGASRGIGAAIARELAARGWNVVAAARTESATARVVSELEAGSGQRALAVAMDVADPRSVQAGVARAREFASEVGPIEALVNNAGIAVSAPLLSGSKDSGDLYDLHMRVNFHGARLVAEELLPEMLERGAGCVVNIGSSAALQGYAYVAAYCASKHALLGWSRAAAEELGAKGIRVHTICPHYVDSPMLSDSVARLVEKTGKSEEEARSFFASQNPGGSLVTPEAVAAAVLRALEGELSEHVLELDGSST